MALYGLVSFSGRWADRKIGEDWLTYAVNASTTGDEWSTVQLAIPSDILDGYIYQMQVVSTNSPATARNMDQQRERVVVSLLKGAGLAGVPSLRTIEASEELANGSNDVNSGVPSAWVARFPPLNVHVVGADQLSLVLPPADDSGTPTADYSVTVGLRDVTYTKK